jgi:hypothetical protein
VQKVRDLDPWDRSRILKGEEESGAGALIRRKRQHVLAVELDASAGHLILRMAGNREGERRFAAAVGAHERVNFSRLDREVDPFEDFLAGDFAPEVR